MKKTLSAILALLLLILVASGCQTPGGEQGTDTHTPADSTVSVAPETDAHTTADSTVSAAPETELTVESLIDNWITGVLSKDPDGKTAEVEVCTPYVNALGKNIHVSAPYFLFSDMRKGDEIRLLISSVDEGEPKTVHVSEACVVIPGPNNDNYRQIPPLEDYTVEQKLVDYFGAESQLKLQESNYYWTPMNRVIRIDRERDVYYIAPYYSNIARFAVKGPLAVELSEGDHIYLDVSKHYQYSSADFHSYVVYPEDIIKLRVLETWEYIEQYHIYEDVTEKPALYLYPEAPTEISVKLITDGKLTCTYPAYGHDGWQKVTAHPDGTLIKDGREYYCLYWEAAVDMEPDMTKGACVKGEDSAAYLEYALAALGLTEREANEFIIYWLPRLEQNPYNLITFQTEAYTSVVGLEITPAPDSLLRVCMVAQPLDAPVEIEAQTFEPFVREGFVAVEWGGVMLP